MHIRRYWTPEPGDELLLNSKEDYAETFLEILAEAVRCRLRSHGSVGSMLSGGIDSGSVVALAQELLSEKGRGSLHTFSATGPDPSSCAETRCVHAATDTDGITPSLVSHDKIDPFMQELQKLTWDLNESFDNHIDPAKTDASCCSSRRR